jgi:hypothetical protein
MCPLGPFRIALRTVNPLGHIAARLTVDPLLGSLWIHWDTLDPFGAARLAVDTLGSFVTARPTMGHWVHLRQPIGTQSIGTHWVHLGQLGPLWTRYRTHWVHLGQLGPLATMGHCVHLGQLGPQWTHWVHLELLGSLWIHWDTLGSFGTARPTMGSLGHIGFIWNSLGLLGHIVFIWDS